MGQDRELRPNNSEKEFLNLAYNRFYDLYDEIDSDSFWEKDDWYRFCKIKDAFGVYTELLNYPPVQGVIEHIRKSRPPIEAEIGSDLFKFVRNVIIHFPFFDKWDDVHVSKNIINWYKEGQSIDKFLDKYKGHKIVKFRIWEFKKKKMTYININFPKNYSLNEKVYLKDILKEKEGITFSIKFMGSILDTQIEK